jgi:hypothetical protein
VLLNAVFFARALHCTIAVHNLLLQVLPSVHPSAEQGCEGQPGAAAVAAPRCCGQREGVGGGGGLVGLCVCFPATHCLIDAGACCTWGTFQHKCLMCISCAMCCCPHPQPLKDTMTALTKQLL